MVLASSEVPKSTLLHIETAPNGGKTFPKTWVASLPNLLVWFGNRSVPFRCPKPWTFGPCSMQKPSNKHPRCVAAPFSHILTVGSGISGTTPGLNLRTASKYTRSSSVPRDRLGT